MNIHRLNEPHTSETLVCDNCRNLISGQGSYIQVAPPVNRGISSFRLCELCYARDAENFAEPALLCETCLGTRTGDIHGIVGCICGACDGTGISKESLE